MVSWEDATTFCRLLSRAEERIAGRSYRLPTEAEWGIWLPGRNRHTIRPRFGIRGRARELRFAVSLRRRFPECYDWRNEPCDTFSRLALGACRCPRQRLREWCSDWYSESYITKPVPCAIPRVHPLGNSKFSEVDRGETRPPPAAQPTEMHWLRTRKIQQRVFAW